MDNFNNKRKKLLTIDDLIKFCENKQLTYFSSKDSGYQLAVQVPANLTFEENDDLNNSGMLYCKLRVCHTNLNRNGSFISEENMKKALPSLKYRPLLAHIHQLDDGTWDFHSHDMEITENGIEYIEKQIGAFTADEPYLEYDEEMDKTYVIAYAAVPEDYTMAADIIREKNGTTVSCELSIENMSYNAKEKYLELQDFYFSGCACLGSEKDGKEIQPGMEGARLDILDFSQENNSIINYSEENQNINNKLIETLEALNNTLSKFNINQAEVSAKETLEEGGNRDVDNQKFLELLEKYNKVETDVEFEIEGLSNEELETKFAEVFGKESEEDPASEEGDGAEETEVIETHEEESETVEEIKETEEEVKIEESEEDRTEIIESEETHEEEFETEVVETHEEESEEVKETEVTEEINNEDVYSSTVKYSVEFKGAVKNYEVSLDEKIYAIQDLVNLTYGESDNTYYGVKVYENYVIMLDYWSGRAYKQSYSQEDDSYTLTGDRVEVYSIWVTKEEEESLNEMRSNYASLEQFKVDTEKAQLHAEREAIIYNEKYSVLSEKDENNNYKNEAYAKLVSEMDNYSLDDLEKELKSVFADYITNGGQFAYAGETESKSNVSKKTFATPTSKKTSRYGNLFNK